MENQTAVIKEKRFLFALARIKVHSANNFLSNMLKNFQAMNKQVEKKKTRNYLKFFLSFNFYAKLMSQGNDLFSKHLHKDKSEIHEKIFTIIPTLSVYSC